MYGFDQETPESQGVNPMPAGINEDVKLMDIAYEPSKEGSTDMCLSFYFENKDGQQLRHVEWPIDPEETRKRAMAAGEDPQTAVQNRYKAQGIRIKHIVTKVIPAEKAVVKAETFQQYATGVSQLVKAALPAGPFRLKVLLNKKDYSTLPPYTPFIEKQEEGVSTGLRIGPKEKIHPASARSAGTASEMPDDDLPF